MFVATITPDSKGNIWFVADYGNKLAKFDGNDSWTLYDTSDGIMGSVIHSIAHDLDNNTWIGTNKGASCYNGKKWKNYTEKDGLINNLINQVIVDNENNKWFRSFKKGISKFDGNKWTNYDTSNGLPEGIEGIAADSKGSLWMYPSTVWQGVSKFDGKKCINFIEENNLLSNHVYTMDVDSKGAKWIVTSKNISKYFNDTWTHNAIPNKYDVSTFTIDSNDTHWGVFYNYETGSKLTKLVDKKWKFYDITNEKVDNVTKMAIDLKQNVWLGTFANGLLKYNGSSWKLFTSKDGLVDDRIFSITVGKDDDIWVGTPKGASIYDGKKWKTFTSNNGLLNDEINQIVVDKNNNTWFACQGKGIACLKNKDWEYYDDKDIFTDFNISDFLIDKNNTLWVSGDKLHSSKHRYGVCKYQKGKWTTISVDDDALIDNNITSLIEDEKGDIWALSEYGISIIKNSIVGINNPIGNGINNVQSFIPFYNNQSKTLVIKYYVAKFKKIFFSLYSINGKCVYYKKLQNTISPEGKITIPFRNISPGSYVCAFETSDNTIISEKIMIYP